MAELKIRCSDEERELWVQAADGVGTSLSAWVREKLNEASGAYTPKVMSVPPPTHEVEVDDVEEWKSSYEPSALSRRLSSSLDPTNRAFTAQRKGVKS